MTTTDQQWVDIIEPVARELLGEPNSDLSKGSELRFGSRGSMSVDLEKGVWYDNETKEGGGVTDLIKRETKDDPGEWLRKRGYVNDDTPRRKPSPSAPARRVVGTFNYPDGDGTLIFQVLRYEPKDFRQRRPDDTQPDGWTWSTRGVKQVPYRLPEVIEALAQDQTIFIVEGEKCVDKLWELGLPATCNAGGAGKWIKRFADEYFADAEVVVIPDYDPQATNPKTGEPKFTNDGEPVLPGQDHAMAVGRSLDGIAKSVRVLDLGKVWADIKPKGDIYDWFEAGNTRQAFDTMAEKAEPWSEALELSYPGRSAAPKIEPGGLEDRVALEFSAKYVDSLRYVAMWNRWLQWGDVRWRFETTLRAFDLSRELCRKAKSAKSKTVAAVISLARTDRRQAATVEQWDTDKYLLGTSGGTVDLRTGTLIPARPEDYITKIAMVAPATEPPAISCQLWLEFLQRVTKGDRELQYFLQRVCGYCLTGDTREDAIFFFYGLGGNGKSTFLNTIAGILDEYHKTAAMDTFTVSHGDRHPCDLADLRGARLVTAYETEEGKRWDESKLKTMTGGDPIKARFMRQDPFEYIPQFKLMIGGNHKPVIRSVDEAIRRRMNLIPFTTVIPKEERDNKLRDKLREEWPGILRWMIEGCLAWQQDGLKPPESVRLATKDYLVGEDALGRFIDEACVTGKDQSDTSAHLWDGWVDWAEDNREYVGSRKSFVQALEDKGYRRSKARGERIIIGIRCIRENRKNLMEEARKNAFEAQARAWEARTKKAAAATTTPAGARAPDDDEEVPF